LVQKGVRLNDPNFRYGSIAALKHVGSTCPVIASKQTFECKKTAR
jgi:hypothetical protein